MWGFRKPTHPRQWPRRTSGKKVTPGRPFSLTFQKYLFAARKPFIARKLTKGSLLFESAREQDKPKTRFEPREHYGTGKTEAGETVRYLEPLIGFLCFLWLTVAAMWAAKRFRTWQAKAESLMGLSGMSFCGLVAYRRWTSRPAHEFLREEGLLVGIIVGIFVILWLEGSWNLLKRFGKRSRHEHGTVE